MGKTGVGVTAIALVFAWAGAQLAVPAAKADSPAPPIREKDVTIKRLASGVSEITLPETASNRLHIETSKIQADPKGRKVAPYSSILYDLNGASWVYAEVVPRTYERKPVEIERISGADAYLKSGPPAGTQIVAVGSIELYGTEVGVNGE